VGCSNGERGGIPVDRSEREPSRDVRVGVVRSEGPPVTSARRSSLRGAAASRDALDSFVWDAVVQLGLLGAAVIRIGPGGGFSVVSSWPGHEELGVTFDGADTLAELVKSRRGVAVWRPGSRAFTELAQIAGVASAGRAALIAAVRITTPSADFPEVVVAISADADRDADELARELARLSGPAAPVAAVETGSDSRMARLVDLGLHLAGELVMGDLLPALVASARGLFDAQYVAIGVLDPSGTTIENFESIGMDAATRARIGQLPTGHGLLGVLLEDPRPVRLARIADDPRACGFPPGHPPMDSFLGVPILLGGVLLGNLYMTEKRGGPFTADDERLAQLFAAQAAVALDNARRFARERMRITTLEDLQGTVRAVQDVLAEGLRTNQSLDVVLSAVVGRVCALGGAEGACVALIDNGRLVVRAAQGMPAMCETIGSDSAPSVEAITHVLRDLLEMPVEAVELRVGSELAGVLAAVGDTMAGFGARAVMQAVASQLALALANERARFAEHERVAAATALDLARERERSTAEGFRRAIRAQEAERGRIARELHDEAGQVMMAVALHLRALEQAAQDVQQREDLEELHAIVSEAAAGLHEMISDLRPGLLREHGLGAAIDQQASRTSEATGIEIGVNLDALPALPDEVEIALYRIVQEALVNVVRHSGATSASVTAARVGDRLRLVIEDNGRGFDPNAPTRRHGLLGMSERMALLGGQLHVDASPRGGSAIIAELDLALDPFGARDTRSP
jgi:signal transduction histidine kinase